MTGRRLSEMRGALIFVEKWEFKVIELKSGGLEAGVKMDLLRVLGNEGEATIGDPRDFNSYRSVIDLLTDPKRRLYDFPFLLSLIW